MEFSIDQNWLTIIISILFWLTPIGLTINLAIARDKPDSYRKKIGYAYSIIWAIALLFYVVLFFKGN